MSATCRATQDISKLKTTNMWYLDPYEELKHDLRKEHPCRYYFRPDQTCKYGEACAFSHNPSMVKPCRFFIPPDFDCKYGVKCQFRHDKPDEHDEREKFNIQNYKQREKFKLEEMRKQYKQEKIEASKKYGIMPFDHGKFPPDEFKILTWEEAIAKVLECKKSVTSEIQKIPGYKELFKGKIYYVPSVPESKGQEEPKCHQLNLNLVMVANWDTGEISPMPVKNLKSFFCNDKIEQTSDPAADHSTQPADANNNVDDQITCKILECTEPEASDAAISRVLADIELEKKELRVLESSDDNEAKIKVDIGEQEKNDLMISISLSEEEKEKKMLLLSMQENESEAKITADRAEKEAIATSKQRSSSANVDTPIASRKSATEPPLDDSKPDTPTALIAKAPANTPSTAEAKKKQVSISPKHECIPTRLERMCVLIKEFYETLTKFFRGRNMSSWTPLHVHTLYNETLQIGLEDFHKFEQHVLLNCLFDHWHPSLTDWAEFITLVHEDIKTDNVHESEDESLQLLAFELLWWIKEKEENPVFVGATYAGLLSMPCGEWRNLDIHYMIDTIICEMDSTENLSGLIMAGMSKYMDMGEFARYVNSYMLSMGSVDVTKCSCTTYECNCPLDLYWEEGLSVLEPVLEYGLISKEDEDLFICIATEMVWDEVQLRMVVEELFFDRICEDIDDLMKTLKPIPRSESELDHIYASSDETYTVGTSSLESTESVCTSDTSMSSELEDGLVEYNLEEMEKGNLAGGTTATAAFDLHEELAENDPDNNIGAELDHNLGAAIEKVHASTRALRKSKEGAKHGEPKEHHKSPSARKEKGATAGEKRLSPRMEKTKRWVASLGSPQKRYNTRLQSRKRISSVVTEDSAIIEVKSADVRPKEPEKKPGKPKSPRARKSPPKPPHSGKPDNKSPNKPTNKPKPQGDANAGDPAEADQDKDKAAPTTKSPRRKRRKSNTKKSPTSPASGKDGAEEKQEEEGTPGKPSPKSRKEKAKERQQQSETAEIKKDDGQPDKQDEETSEPKKKHPQRRRSGRKSGGKGAESDAPITDEHSYAKSGATKSPSRQKDDSRAAERPVDHTASPASGGAERRTPRKEKERRRSVESKPPQSPEDALPCKTWKGLCRNKGKLRCVQGMCANCCIQTDEECKVHEITKKQKMTRNLIPACITGGIGKRSGRIDYSRISPFRYFAKKLDLEHFLKNEKDMIIHRVSFGPHFGIRDDHVIEITEHVGENLLVIDLGCSDSGDGARLTDRAVYAITKNCPKLIKLKMESCTSITNESVSALLECCPDLQHLEVTGHDKQKGKVTAEVLEPLFGKKGCMNLRTLCLNDQLLGDTGVIRRLNRCRPTLRIYNTDTYDYDRYMYWGGHYRY